MRPSKGCDGCEHEYSGPDRGYICIRLLDLRKAGYQGDCWKPIGVLLIWNEEEV
jgi:hypothetical protein